MPFWSVFPPAGQPESIVFSTSKGPVTRAELEARVRAQLLAELPDRFASQEVEPAALLVELASTWLSGSVVVLEGQVSGQRRPFGSGAELPLPARGLLDLLRFDDARPLVELFTSGTMGRPARYTKTADQLLGEAKVLGPLFGLTPGSVVLSTVPLHHLYGLLFGLLAPLAAGAHIVSDPASDPGKFHPHRLAQVVLEHEVTHLVTVPAHIRSLLDANLPLPGVREVVSSAAALPIDWARHFEQLTGARLIDVLGSTESGGIAWRRSACDERYQPLPGVVVRASEDGHLEVTSPFARAGEPLLTGDRVELRGGGAFVHLGRDDGVVKVGGKRLSLLDLEAAALAIVGVTDAFAFARPTSRVRGSEVCLVVASQTLGRGALRGELTRRVPPLLLPRRLCVLPALPRNSRGKLAKSTIERFVLLPGFDLLDLALNPLRATVRLRADSRRLDGHFPGFPVLPAVAQLLDLVVPEVEQLAGKHVSSVRRLKWHGPIRPGDVVVFTLEAARADCYRFSLLGQSGVLLASGTLETDAPAE